MRHQYRESEPARLDGAHKVAALMLALYPIDKEYVGRLLKRFSEVELMRITASASDLGAISPAVLTNLMNELSGELTSGPHVLGSHDEAQNLLNAAMPDSDMTEFISSIDEEPAPSVWEQLSELDGPALANAIRDEPIQIAAYILAQLPSEAIAKSLEALPQETAAELLTRMIQTAEAPPVAAACVEEGLAPVLASAKKEQGLREKKVAESLNQMSPDLIDTLMDKIRVKLPKQAELISKNLFDFRDAVSLPEAARKVIMERIKQNELIVALNGEGAEIREAFLSTMGARARKMVEQELNDARPLPPKTVQAAQKAIATKIVALIQSGDISRDA